MNYFLGVLTAVVVLTSCKNKPKKTTIQKNNIEQVKAEVKSEKTIDTSDMVHFNGGAFTLGSNNRTPIEAPAYETTVAPFYLDINLVTVADFRKFIEATNHVTEAENFGDSGVFNFNNLGWSLVKGVTWEYPFGINAPKAKDNHPVTHVSWNDASAYAKWLGKRLPTEEEFEFAGKNNKNLTYPWGNSTLKNNKIMANTWDGKTIKDQVVKDGYLYTSPVGFFPKSESGINDLVGNVWQWTNTVFAPHNKNIPFNKNTSVVVTKGGSFMYDKALELSYTTTFRSKNSKESSLFNTGFRCALSAN